MTVIIAHYFDMEVKSLLCGDKHIRALLKGHSHTHTHTHTTDSSPVNINMDIFRYGWSVQLIIQDCVFVIGTFSAILDEDSKVRPSGSS